MRVDHLHQVLGEHRLLRIEFQLHARGQKREAFQQPLHVRVGAFEAFHAQPAGDLRILARELAAHFTDVLQFPVVITQQARVHDGQPKLSETLNLPVSRSTSVFRYRFSGIGCAHISDSMLNTSDW